ncbi:MAG: hypothetical protein K2H88_04975 [Duncaniella sp.]|nr:hypothetical protein [Duncaniella sp.]MDE5751974.1 hypothetical protein [Duncaniella sp.]MDE5918832.1 hypothetical protein [Duncaniella sp.]
MKQVYTDHTEIVGRLRHIMQLRRLTQRRLAELLRLDPSNMSKVMNGKLPFTDGLVNRIVVDLGISKSWLCRGEGVPFEKPGLIRDLAVVAADVVPAEMACGTPVYDLDVTAGCRSLASIFGEVRPAGRVMLPEIPENCSLVKVRGDSMEPRIMSGGYVAIRPIADMRNIFWGQIYVVELDELRLVKFVRRHSDPAKFILHSDNPAYDDMDVDRADVRSMYIVEAILNYELQ